MKELDQATGRMNFLFSEKRKPIGVVGFFFFFGGGR